MELRTRSMRMRVTQTFYNQHTRLAQRLNTTKTNTVELGLDIIDKLVEHKDKGNNITIDDLLSMLEVTHED